MSLRHGLLGLVVALLALIGGGACAIGRPPSADKGQVDPSVTRIDESGHLGQPVAMGTELVDAQGRGFRLGEWLGKPTILVLSYYGCDGSCPTVNQNLAAALVQVQRFQAGRDYRVLTVSFDRSEDAATAQHFADKLRTLPAELRDGWRFAVLGDRGEGSTERFAGTVGFRFFWSRIDKTFLHPNVVVFLTPEGRVARYLYGTRLDARTIELALIDADWGRISESGSAIFDMVTGACFSFNYAEGRYQPNYALFAGLGSLAFGLGLIGAGLFGYRRKLARRSAHAQ